MTEPATTQPLEAIAPRLIVALPQHWPAQNDLLTWCQTMTPGTAAILCILGVVFLLFGWYMYRALVTLNAALFGAYIGAYLGSRTNDALAGALIGGFTAAALTWPLMKWAVAVMGGLLGAALGASLWRSFSLDPQFAWAGGLCGLIFFGMLSFILFRGSVIMYTSLQGSFMLIFGILGLIYKYQSIAPMLTQNMTTRAFILPAIIFVPAVFGLIYQQMNYPAADAKKK
jgi:hypothetical protein